MMKQLLILSGIAFFFSCKKAEVRELQSQTEASQRNDGNIFNMLWNGEGVTKRSFIYQSQHLDMCDTTFYPAVWQLCDLSEAPLAGNPGGTWPYHYETNHPTVPFIEAPNQAAPSFKVNTEG